MQFNKQLSSKPSSSKDNQSSSKTVVVNQAASQMKRVVTARPVRVTKSRNRRLLQRVEKE